MSPARLRRLKIILSALIVFHLMAITLAPASVAPASPTIQKVWEFFSPYLLATNLNHGYHFFAPEPGPSTLLEYVVIDEKGNRRWGRIPDRSSMQPRLLYHRYFMLTEFLGSIDSTDPIRANVLDTYAQQLLRSHNGVSIELKMVTHQLLRPEAVSAGSKIDDPDTYDIESLGTFHRKK